MTSDPSDSFSAIQGALASIGVSALVVIGGSVINHLMGFGTRIVMTRFLPVDGYGQIVLGISVLNVLAIVSLLGLGPALIRYLPRADSTEERAEITAAIYHIAVLLSLFWGIVAFVSASFIAGTIFDQPGMANIVRIFAAALPFYALYKLSLKGIQGQKRTIPNVAINNIALPVTRLGAVAVFAVSGFGALGLATGYNIGFVAAGSLGFFLYLRTDSFRFSSLFSLVPPCRYRDILAFSLPLAANASISIVTQQADVLLLGVLGTKDMVGVYDIVFLLSQVMMFFSPALNYLFQPLISEYHSEGRERQMGGLYSIITRWLIIATFPIFSLLVLAPEGTLGTLFGSDYSAGGTALVILAIGYFISRMVGLSGSFLVATGETKAVMYISAATASLNVTLNLLLIPPYGIVGAALATAGSIVLRNVLQAGYVYNLTNIHPFKRELIQPMALMFVFLVGVKLFVLPGTGIRLFTGLIASAVLGTVNLLTVAATRSVYMVELKLLDALLGRLGVDLGLSERLSLLTR